MNPTHLVRACTFAALFTALTAHAQLHKCVNAAGKVEYRDSACSSASDAKAMSRGTVSGMDFISPQEMERATAPGPWQQYGPNSVPATTPSSCLGAQDVKNVETSGSSIRHDAYDRLVWMEQVRRARACEPLMSEADIQMMKARLRAEARAGRPAVITSCDPGGCWDSNGRRYTSAAGGMTRDDGTFCRRTGQQVTCR